MADEGLEPIGEDECYRLLSSQRIGRLAFLDADDPLVLPVNYVLEGRDVLFRTGAGAKLRAAARGARVAFEVDGTDVMYRGGWSVLLVGAASEVDDRAADPTAPRPTPWAAGERDHLVRIRPERVTGRRIPLGPR